MPSTRADDPLHVRDFLPHDPEVLHLGVVGRDALRKGVGQQLHHRERIPDLVGDFGREQAKRREALAATQAFFDGEDLRVEAGVLDRGGTERRERGDQVLVVVGETIGSHRDAEQDAEGVVLITDRHGERRRRGHGLGQPGEEVFLGLAGERHHHRAAAGDDRPEGGAVQRDARREHRGAEVSVHAAQVQHLVDEVVVSAGARPRRARVCRARSREMPGSSRSRASPWRGAHERFELGGLGTELTEEPDAADGLGSFVREQRKEGDVLLGEGVEAVGVAVHDADDVPP
jgi:hypothetical protein